jgi:hypothetical protein
MHHGGREDTEALSITRFISCAGAEGITTESTEATECTERRKENGMGKKEEPDLTLSSPRLFLGALCVLSALCGNYSRSTLSHSKS